MYLSKMLPVLFPLLSSVFVLATFLVMPTSKGETLEYKACSSRYSCGLIQNIGYPFWGGDRPQFCGHHEFLLSCNDSRSDQYPSIDIGTPRLQQVLDINASAQTMIIGLHRFLGPNATCRTERRESMLNLKTTFKLSSNIQNLSLFYSCPRSVLKYQPKSFACLNPYGMNESAFYFSKRSASVERVMQSCMAKFIVPVLEKEMDKLNNGNATLLGVLRKGFEVEYVVNSTACLACQNSGGQCGSTDGSSSEFVCYCPDGSQPLMCHKSGPALLLALAKHPFHLFHFSVIQSASMYLQLSTY